MIKLLYFQSFYPITILSRFDIGSINANSDTYSSNTNSLTVMIIYLGSYIPQLIDTVLDITTNQIRTVLGSLLALVM
jgi:hypothetical protein